MREADVESAFAAHLHERGWDVTTENDDYSEGGAKRGVERIVAEVKGHTTSPGLDIDTLYGQLLRRMTTRHEETRFVVVVPASMVSAATRVPWAIRELLNIARRARRRRRDRHLGRGAVTVRWR